METLLQYFPNFMLVLCRITAFFVVAPIFSARNVPMQFKIGFSALLAFIISSAVGGIPVDMDGTYLISIAKETLIGLLLGFVAYLFFTVVQIAGSFADMQIGFSMANVINPLTGAQSPLLGNLKFALATLMFLSMNGHHLLIQAILESYRWVPLSNDVFAQLYHGEVTEFLLKSLSKAFTIAFQMAAPLVAALFLTDVGLGILARTAPQFNIFVVGMPLKILVGLLVLLMLIPGFVTVFGSLFGNMMDAVSKMTQLLAGNSS